MKEACMEIYLVSKVIMANADGQSGQYVSNLCCFGF